jgi:uncharacterized protein (UPF0212 family)
MENELKYKIDMNTYHTKEFVADAIGLPISRFRKLLNVELLDILEEETGYQKFQKCLYPLQLHIIDRETKYLRVYQSNINFNQ